MNTDQINKRFAELAGIHIDLDSDGQCSCGQFHSLTNPIPDYCADPRRVLEVMMKREDWMGDFGFEVFISPTGDYGVISVDIILDKTGQLALKAIEWMEERND